MKDRTYNINQIEKAFWDMFNESGEWWFSTLKSSEENGTITESYFQDFVMFLNDIKNGTETIERREGKTSHSWV